MKRNKLMKIGAAALCAVIGLTTASPVFAGCETASNFVKQNPVGWNMAFCTSADACRGVDRIECNAKKCNSLWNPTCCEWNRIFCKTVEKCDTGVCKSTGKLYCKNGVKTPLIEENKNSGKDTEEVTIPETVTKEPAGQQAVAEEPVKKENAETPQEKTAGKNVLELVNQERTEQGLDALVWNEDVAKVAQEKAEDMARNGYFSHTSPTYGSPFEMMKSFGISYSAAGENIAKGYTTPEAVMHGWMNSEGHRANILNSQFTQLGVGVAKDSNGALCWVQMFIR